MIALLPPTRLVIILLILPLKRVRVVDLLVVTRSAHLWSGLSDEDAVKVCLILVVNIVFIDREPKNYIVDNLLELVDDLPAWDPYPWGEYIWKAFYKRNVNVISRHRVVVMKRNQKNASIRNKKKKSPTSKKNETYNVYGFVWALKIYILKMYTNNIYWWKKYPLVIPCGLSWSKIEPQFEAEVALERQSELDVPMFTREELVAEHHAIKERVQIIENLADADPSIILQQLAAVKERITAIETFLNYPKVRYHVLNGEFSCDINRPNEHMFEESIENELESGDGKHFVTGTEGIHLDELLSENGDQLLNTTDVVEGEKYENDVHVDQSPVEQKCQDLALYLNEVNVVNEKEPPSAVKVIGQLLQKTYKGKAQVEPYTIQPPTTASVHLGKAIRKRKKKFAKRLQSRKRRILFDADGDDDHDVMFISLEDWNTQSNKTRKRKDAIPLSKIAKSEFPFVEYCEDLSRPPYSQRNKVKLPKFIDQVITIGDETTHLLAWGNYDVKVDRPVDADWAIAGPYFYDFVMRESDIPGWVCNEVRYHVIWADVEQVFFSINKLRTHYCLDVLHIWSGVITLYDLMGVSIEETREWWSDIRIAFKIRIPQYLHDWGILEAKCIDPKTYNIKFDVRKDVPLQGIVLNVPNQIANGTYTLVRLKCILLEKMRCSNRICKVKDIQHDMSIDWKIDISYKRAWGGRNIALKMMNGSHEDSFSQLPYYCYNLKLANEGTVTHIHTDADGRFEMLYVRFGFAIRSFLRYMRPLIIIDGAHLKGNYSGTNPLVVGMDDRHAAIILACSTVFYNSFHGFCDRHLMMNCNLKGKKHRGIFWKACKAYTMQAIDKTISKLRAYRPEAINKLEQTEAPVHELSDWASAKVYDRMLKSAKWTVKGIDHLQLYQVCNTKEVHKVDLLKFKCTCRKWQLSRIPCGHVCAVCRVFGLTNCSLWAKPWFTKTTLKDTYQELVYPLKDPKLWETPNDLQVVLSPIMNKRPPGRPKNKDQIRSTNEAPTLASCTRCGMNEHSRNGCNQPFPSKYATTNRKQEHLSQEARLDEERLWNGRIYMNWIDYEATKPMVSHLDNYAWTQVMEEPVTREDRGVEDWQAVEGRLDSYTPYFNFLSQPDQGNIQHNKHVETSIQTQHTDRIIPGHADIVQSAMQLKQMDTLIGRDEDRMSTQEYMKELVEDVGEDDDFKSTPWVSATDYVNDNGGIVSRCLGDIDKYLNNGKLDLVVSIVKSCSLNVISDLTFTMKDPLGKIPGTIHYKVLDEGTYRNDITIGASMILINISVFTPKPLVHYLNITRRNVVNIFHKDMVHVSDSV
ncbi:transposase, MuDR, MULE transposase domain protein [Tanacetum coccineum]